MVFHLSDLLFWAEYYKTVQDIGLLTIAVGQRRPVWIYQTCTVQRQHLSQTSHRVELKTKCYVLRLQFWPFWAKRTGRSLNGDLLFMTQLALAWSLELKGLNAPKRGLLFMTQIALAYLSWKRNQPRPLGWLLSKGHVQRIWTPLTLPHAKTDGSRSGGLL